MNKIDQKKANACGKKIRAELEKLLQMARDAGVARPMIFIESEHHIYVLDRDHPGYVDAHKLAANDRQEATVVSIFGALPEHTDVGAW